MKEKNNKKQKKGKEAKLLQIIHFKTGILPVFFIQKRMKSHVMLQHLLQASCNKALRWAGRDKSKKKDKDRNTIKEELSSLIVDWTKRHPLFSMTFKWFCPFKQLFLCSFQKKRTAFIDCTWQPQPPFLGIRGQEEVEKMWFDYWETLLTCCCILHSRNRGKGGPCDWPSQIFISTQRSI